MKIKAHVIHIDLYSLLMETQPFIPDFALNLRRLFAWHMQSNKDVAVLLGASEHSVSGWVTGKREPGTKFLKAIGELYGVDAIKMLRDPDAFGSDVSDPERYRLAEERISARLRAS